MLWTAFDAPLAFLYLIVSLVFVVTLHEFAHAWTAYILGDPTAKHKGRVSLNPLSHLDPMGTLLILFVGIGWGKPVPVNSQYFRNPKLYEAATAVAGPLMNLVIALITVIPLKYFPDQLGPYLYNLLNTLWQVSILLFVFNMLPFPPLDGSKFIQIFIPRRWEHTYQKYLVNAGVYFMIFVVLDHFILDKYLGFSILQYVLSSVFVFIKAILFFGS